MRSPLFCPVCKIPLSPGGLEGFCPKCLWASLLTGNDTFESKSFFNPPGPRELLGIIDDYELLNEIARGGMGVVYRAKQISLGRIVALKMVLTARLPGEEDMKRFRAEAEAVASLEHRNIVPIYEIGDTDGHPYFTMKFITGGSLADRPKSSAPPASTVELRNLVELVAKIAHAVHFAHQRGILHRDLKPSNILIDERGEPLVTDFGLAKEIEADANLTLSGAVLGTPAYIAPEQAAGIKNLTTAADVYSLGAIFYELLTLQAPFKGATALDTLRLVIDQDPIPPTKISSELDKNLEAICLKCLHKNPAERYTSAEALADDLERWLRNEPIYARNSTWSERVIKWGKRHPARAGLVSLAIVGPAILLAVVLAGQSDVRQERNHALEQERRAKISAANSAASAREALDARAQTRQNLYAADMLLAQHALDDGNLNLARRLVEAYRPKNASGAAQLPDLRGFEWRYLWERCQGDTRSTFYGHSNPVHSVAFSADSKRAASGDSQGNVIIWDVASRTAITSLTAEKAPVERVTFSPDGTALATGDRNGTATVWDLASGRAVWTQQGRNPAGVAF